MLYNRYQCCISGTSAAYQVPVLYMRYQVIYQVPVLYTRYQCCISGTSVVYQVPVLYIRYQVIYQVLGIFKNAEVFIIE